MTITNDAKPAKKAGVKKAAKPAKKAAAKVCCPALLLSPLFVRCCCPLRRLTRSQNSTCLLRCARLLCLQKAPKAKAPKAAKKPAAKKAAKKPAAKKAAKVSSLPSPSPPSGAAGSLLRFARSGNHSPHLYSFCFSCLCRPRRPRKSRPRVSSFRHPPEDNGPGSQLTSWPPSGSAPFLCHAATSHSFFAQRTLFWLERMGRRTPGR